MSDPAPGRQIYTQAEKAKARASREALATKYGLRRFDLTRRGVGIILRSAGADEDLVNGHLGDGTSGHIRIGAGPFDHAEMWGKHGVPMAWVGHPYSLRDEDNEVLEFIRSLGLKVTVDNDSHYGFGTDRVIVWHAQLEPA